MVEVITPAWEADVNCKALISNIKYKHGSKKTITRRYLISEGVKERPLKYFQKKRKTIDAATIRPKIILIGPIEPNAILRAIKELAQMRVAPMTAIVPIALLLRGFLKISLSC
jgi:hypothetical protein